MTKITTAVKRSLNLILFLLVPLYLLTAISASDDKTSVEPEKATTVEQTDETSADKPEGDSRHCESELDRQICNTVNKGLVMYYQISNHIPPGFYERKYSMRNLIYDIEVTRQDTIDESGHSDSIDMYTAFIDFVKFKEKTEILFAQQDYDGADYNRTLAFENHDEIIEYCKTCVDVLK